MNFPKYPYQPFDQPIPAPPSDKGALCFSIDAKWRPYLVGLLKTLLIERTWESNQTQATGEASQLLEEILIAEFCSVPMPGIESEDCMGCCIRVENGHLQTFSCGEWSDVPGGDLTQIIQGTPSQPEGNGPPEAGSCKEYNLTIQAGLPTLLPTPVDEGDTIEITTWSGAWSDGSGIGAVQPYYCADGGQYLLGVCTGVFSIVPGDPLPTANHMSIIANVADLGAYLAPMGSPRTVPIGASGAQVFFQANDDTLGDNIGGVSFHVKVCKPVSPAIAVAYTVGSGPSAVSLGQTVIMTFVNEGPDNGLDFSLSEEISIEIVGSSGWNFNGTASANRFISGVNVQNYDLSATLPQDAGISGCVDRMTWGCGPGGTTQIQIKFNSRC